MASVRLGAIWHSRTVAAATRRQVSRCRCDALPKTAVSEQTPTEFLFSYGTLQLEAVQRSTFGRLLSGTGDALPGFELAPLKIEDPKVIAISGKATHTIAKFTGRDSDEITGTVFHVTADEIENADRYEVDACKRIAFTLRSGIRAWVYVDASSVPPQRFLNTLLQ